MQINIGLKEAIEANGFTIISKIGSGSYADVYKVEWNQYPNHQFAAKVFHLDGHTENSISTSYLQEVLALTNLDNPHIIKFFKYFHVDKAYVLIFEYCSNGSLDEKIKKLGHLKENKFIPIARECLMALSTCHANGISHRDIKPGNILLDSYDHIKFCDFGMSCKLAIGEKSNSICGSYAYLAPEVIFKKPYDPQKTDIWSLGVSFCVLLTGKLPWDVSSMDNMITSIKNATPIYPVGISSPLLKLLRLMLHPIPEERPSAEEILKLPMFEQRSNLPLLASDKNCLTSSSGRNLNISLSGSSRNVMTSRAFLTGRRRRHLSDQV